MSASDNAVGSVMILSIMAGIACVAAWLTHVIWIIKALASASGATAGQIALGALGAFMPPIGVIHGFILWFS